MIKMKISWKHLILIFSTAVLLDLISSHFVANILLNRDLSISEIASTENSWLLSKFWILSKDIILGEVLDFLAKFLGAIGILGFLLNWDRVTRRHHGLIFFGTVAMAWLLFFFGAIRNTVYLITTNYPSAIVNLVGGVIFILLCFIAAATLEEKRNPIIISAK